MTSVFTPEDVIKYAERRLFGKNITPSMVDNIVLHNGMLGSVLEATISDGLKVIQDNPRETIVYSPNERTLHIAQPSGTSREDRYRSMIVAYTEASKSDIHFATSPSGRNPKKDSVREAYINYSNHAYDFVVGLFVPEKKYERNRVFKKHDVKDIEDIVFGPLSAVAKKSDNVIAVGESEYLDAQIVQIGKKMVLNVGYVYGDQAGRIIDKMLREYAAVADEKDRKLSLNIYMFGRVGSLKDSLGMNSLVFPTGIIEEVDLREARQRYNSILRPFHNSLAEHTDFQKGLLLNVRSVIDETVDLLTAAKNHNCICVEMETKAAVSKIDEGRGDYHRNLRIDFGFVGHVSDLPLKKGYKLSDDRPTKVGEEKAVEVIVHQIRRE